MRNFAHPLVGTSGPMQTGAACDINCREAFLMSATQATADIFWAAFRSLAKKEREAVVERLVQDREFREDLMDLVIMAQREKESSRSLDEYLADRRKKRR